MPPRPRHVAAFATTHAFVEGELVALSADCADIDLLRRIADAVLAEAAGEARVDSRICSVVPSSPDQALGCHALYSPGNATNVAAANFQDVLRRFHADGEADMPQLSLEVLKHTRFECSKDGCPFTFQACWTAVSFAAGTTAAQPPVVVVYCSLLQ
jgi:hypothetical protein